MAKGLWLDKSEIFTSFFVTSQHHCFFCITVTTNPDWQHQFSSVAQSCLTLQPHGLQHFRLPCPIPTPTACSNTCSLSQWCHPTIPSSVAPSPPAFNLSWHQGLFHRVSCQFLTQVAKVLEFQSFQWIFRTDFLQNWLAIPFSCLNRSQHQGLF